MAKVNDIRTNFTRGEFSPKLFGRVDVDKYFNAAATLRNFIVKPYGGAFKTPGTIFVAPLKDVSEVGRLIPFVFNTEQTYMLEFNDGKIRFYRNSAPVVLTAVNITAITNANPGVVTAAGHGLSNGDTILVSGVAGMTQVNGKRYRVGGVAGNNFNLLDDQAGTNINTTAFGTYTSGGVLEKVYEIASAPYTAADVPALQFAQVADIMYITHPDYLPRTLSRTAHTSWTLSLVSYVNGPFMPVNTTTITMTPSVTTGAGTLTASAAYFTSDMVNTYFRLNGGIVRISGFTSSTVVDMVCSTVLSGTGATTSWEEHSWSEERGYPAAVTFFEQRLFYANTYEQPQTCWGSATNAFEDFSGGSDASDSVSYTIASEQVNAIRWMSGEKVLLIGTSGGVFSMSSGSNSEALTPTNVVVKRETTYGALGVLPTKIGNYTYFVQRDGRTIREIGFVLDIDSYNATNMTILSDHITSGGITEIAYAQAPDNVLYCIRGDGKMATMTREVEQEVAGWTEQTTDGSYEAVAVIPNGDYDQVWCIVKRTINGATKRYIEIFHDPAPEFDNLYEMVFSHSALEYSGASTTTLTNLDHLEGKTVAILGWNGSAISVQAQKTVSGGSITLDSAVTKAVVGLPYTATLKTLRPEAGASAGSAQGLKKKIRDVRARFYQSGAASGMKLGDGTTQDTMSFDSSTALYDIDKELAYSGGWSIDSQVTITHEDPLPCNIIALMQFMETNDR